MRKHLCCGSMERDNDNNYNDNNHSEVVIRIIIDDSFIDGKREETVR